MNQIATLPDGAKTAPAPAHMTEVWPIERLKPYERNARTHSKKQIQQLRDSFRSFGQVWPILVREDGTIIAGHGRLEAAKAEGLTEVRVILASGWSEEQCRAFGILDNRVALNSEWNEALLGVELAELGALGIDPALMGFDLDEAAALTGMGGQAGLTDPDEAPEPPVTPVSIVGDLWALGAHRLLCGDCTVKEDTLRVLGSVKPHLMVTDPPYGVNYDPNWRHEAAAKGLIGFSAKRNGQIKNDDRVDWSPAWALFPGDVAYVWHAGRHAAEVQATLESAKFEIRCQIIWAKDSFSISRGDYHWQHEPCWYAVRKQAKGHWAGDRSQSTLWKINKRDGMDQGSHNSQKPVECMKRPIENNSSPGQAIYEPFAGSGTTIIAAEMTGRSCHAIEIDPTYVDVCIKRWQDFTGKAATLEGDGRTFDEVSAERLKAAA